MDELSLNLLNAMGDKLLVSDLLGEFDKDLDTFMEACARDAVEALNEEFLNNEEVLNQLFPDENVSGDEVKSLVGTLYMMVGQKLLKEL